jgi:hypothetical protein
MAALVILFDDALCPIEDFSEPMYYNDLDWAGDIMD